MPIPTRTPARRARRLLALAVAAASVAALPATAAAAPRHVVIRAFVKTASFAYMQADGTPVAPPPARPAVGDSLETTELAYPGTHRRHARRWRWSGHTICTFIVADAAPRCDSQIALGRNELLLLHTPGGTDERTRVAGGTGRYAGATGTITRRSASGGEDVVIRLTLRR